MPKAPASAPDRATAPSSLPLTGIRVLDLASYIAAPVAATVLADYGADVVKVEPPGRGDPNRMMVTLAAYPQHEVNYPWHLDARGKRSLAIDLKDEAAREALYRLIGQADVFIINLPLNVRERLKLNHSTVAALNPRLIYASFTGYGEEGPDADQPGFDTNAYFARAGLLDGCRYDGALPGVVMPGQGDRAAAIALAMGIMVALWNREKTGRGTKVSSSLFANGIWANGNIVQGALLGAAMPKRPPPHTPRSAVSNLYRMADERWVQLTVVDEPKQFPVLCKALDREFAITDARFTTLELRRKNSAVLAAIFAEAFAAQPYAFWRERLKNFGLPFAVINRASDLARDEQAMAAGIFVETANPELPLTLALPFTIDDVTLPPPRPGPALGEHSAEVLAEAGFTAEEIAGLKSRGVVE
jgi:crotonobetainyl-CoA:carnitine CoA-transferase CaiB-like acyl-CoA transferase